MNLIPEQPEDLGISRSLLEEQWLPQLVRMCHSAGLDWLRMVAIAYLVSDGNPFKRIIDWHFIKEHLGPDNPIALPYYDSEGMPEIELLERGTRWGLFQIHGQVALDHGYKGHLVGLSSVGASIKMAVTIMGNGIEQVEKQITKLETEGNHEQAQTLIDQLPGSVEQSVFGVTPEAVNQTVGDLNRQISNLMDLQVS